jgi:4,4'-diaponeurosporenoate glycosyltransferase
LLAALSRQSYLAQRVIVVDAGSADRTAELAHAAHATVVAPGPAPAGDSATGWARRQGAAAASGSVLVFLDPGTEPGPEFLRRAVAEQLRLGGLLSIRPYRRTHGVRDRLGAFVDLVTVMAVGGVDARPAGGRATGAFGACMVCDRSDYVAVTGNVELRSIPGAPALASRFAAAGRPLHARLGRGSIESHARVDADRRRLHERARDLGAGLRSTPASRRIGIACWCAAAALAVVLACTGAAGWVPGAALYAAFAVQAGLLARRIGDYGWPTALLYPLPLLALVAAAAWSRWPAGGAGSR